MRQQLLKQRNLTADILARVEYGTLTYYQYPEHGPKIETTDLEKARLTRRLAMLDYSLEHNWPAS